MGTVNKNQGGMVKDYGSVMRSTSFFVPCTLMIYGIIMLSVLNSYHLGRIKSFSTQRP